MIKKTKILIVNSGSSSLKSQYFIDQKRVASVVIEQIGEKSSTSTIEYGSNEITDNQIVANHHEALKKLFSLLKESKVLKNIEKLNAVGHRVVHGGSKFNSPTLINDEVIEAISSLTPLAPLHNPANLEAIKLIRDEYPTLNQVAVFDTAFHQTLKEYSYTYALPHKLCKDYDIRRYGFHGTSHSFVAKKSAKILDKKLEELNLITLHLGNGASATAIQAGKSIDTSMGMTPLEGLVMGTRSGDIDPAIIPYLLENSNKSIKEIENILNKKSGLKGICDINDMREVLKQSEKQNKKAKLALDIFVYCIKKYIGAYTVALGKVDAIVFTGGIGEHSPKVRELICQGLNQSIGAKLNKSKNNNSKVKIHSKNSKIKILNISTNEELEIALQTVEVLKLVK